MKRSPRVPAPREMQQEGRLIPFVGAGLSQPLGLPSWDGLIDSVAVQLGYDPTVFRLSGRKEQLAEYFVVEKGSLKPLTRRMSRFFHPPARAVRASTTHRLLVRLKPPSIYTTNYDDVIERAFRIHHARCHTISRMEDIPSAPSDVTYIVKFHGTFSDPASLVMTESDYFNRLDLESALDLKLRADTLGRSLLFLGYSLGDMNIRYLLYKLHKLRGRLEAGEEREPSAYLVAFGTNDIQRKLLKQWDVQVIDLDPRDKTKSLEHFLRSLT
jgi:hypothetical protein